MVEGLHLISLALYLLIFDCFSAWPFSPTWVCIIPKWGPANEGTDHAGIATPKTFTHAGIYLFQAALFETFLQPVISAASGDPKRVATTICFEIVV